MDRRKFMEKADFRQILEGMALGFDPKAAGDLKAVIQFEVSGRDTAVFHLKIEEGECQVIKESAPDPTLIIKTPSEIWRSIGSGELSGADALRDGLYTVHGDMGLLMRFSEIFKSVEDKDFTEPAEPPRWRLFGMFRANGKNYAKSAGKRPPGPLPLGGIVLINLVMMQWLIFFVLYGLLGPDNRLVVGIPLTITTLLVAYRIAFNRPTWMEIATLLFFLSAWPVLYHFHHPTLKIVLPLLGTLFLALIWLGSLLPIFKWPFCAEYARWGYRTALTKTSLFIQPNMAITLVWGWCFLLIAIFSVLSRIIPYLNGTAAISIFLFNALALIFQIRYLRGVTTRAFPDVDRTIYRLRAGAFTGVMITVACFILVFSRL